MIIRSIREVVANRPLHSIGPEETLRAACRILGEDEIGALAVVEGGRLVGILSEHDVIRRAVGRGKRMDETRVAEVMTADPVTVSADGSLAEAMEAMLIGRFRHLPVIEDGSVTGMLSMRDIPTEYRLMFERYTEYRDTPMAAV